MDKIVMQKCCCSLGCKLRSCAIVMSVVHMLSGGLLALLLISGMLPWVGDSVEKRYEDKFAIEIPENRRLLLDSVRTIALYTDIILVILTVPLLVGVIKNIRELLLPWLIVFGSQLIAVTYFCIVFICDCPIFVIFGLVHVVTVLSTAMKRGTLDELHAMVENLFGLLEKHISSSLILLLTIVHCFFAFVIILLSITLLAGVLMEKKKMLLPWLVVNGCQIVAITYSSFVFMTLFPGFMALLWIVSVPFQTYGFVVVLSYYFELLEAE